VSGLDLYRPTSVAMIPFEWTAIIRKNLLDKNKLIQPSSVKVKSFKAMHIDQFTFFLV
jgi:hypothetical protein